jgi:hypothetical protein
MKTLSYVFNYNKYFLLLYFLRIIIYMFWK